MYEVQIVNTFDPAEEVQETHPLRTIGEFLDEVTAEDLRDVLHGTRPMNLLEVGVGTNTVAEELCRESGVEYFVTDSNEVSLAAHTDTSRKAVARSENLPIQDKSFDVTYSRVVTARSNAPAQSIAEQLRVTKDGGTAIFTEFDWTRSKVTDESEVARPYMEAKAIMMLVLNMTGFKPELGAGLGPMIDNVTSVDSRDYTRQEVRHELPEGDYRKLFLEAADNILQQLNMVGRGQAAVLATLLESCMKRVESAAPCTLRLPALVTQYVQAGTEQVVNPTHEFSSPTQLVAA